MVLLRDRGVDLADQSSHLDPEPSTTVTPTTTAGADHDRAVDHHDHPPGLPRVQLGMTWTRVADQEAFHGG